MGASKTSVAKPAASAASPSIQVSWSIISRSSSSDFEEEPL